MRITFVGVPVGLLRIVWPVIHFDDDGFFVSHGRAVHIALRIAVEAAGDQHHTFTQLAVSLQEVEENFRKYGLLDDQVRFLKGCFKDTLPAAPIEKLAILRLDGDMYQSTRDALAALYDKVSPGGFIIVDDYALPACRNAVDDFRVERRSGDPIIPIDWSGVYWRKASSRGA